MAMMLTYSRKFGPFVMLLHNVAIGGFVFSKGRLPRAGIQAPLFTDSIPRVIVGAKQNWDVRYRCHSEEMLVPTIQISLLVPPTAGRQRNGFSSILST